ncbi:DDB1- and CUL4-associated factor 15 isoform X3 [Oncorhynchus mykiss]|uniref:DDB1- and CUL4-associated factor 15 isoform X3 n=1 Tax=Oncorhynchus mykiss TaxID=8022 RepID=UPI0018787146|nr:DDB1- and CUL4-associated factor 15 isoform X3 [Oncorhynchus mykiss]
MAPSSKSEKDGNKQTQRKHKEHVVKLLNRGKLSGQYSQRLFRKLPPRVCVPLKNIVSEEFLRAGHIFLGFTKCGRYVLSYTSDCGEDDDFSFYTYHLYWWEFNLHSRLKQVHHVRLFTGEDIYSDLYLTVCEWPNDHSKIVIFGFNTRSSSSVLMNLMMSDENNRDIYITIASMPPLRPCSQCCPPNTSTIRTGSGECLEHGYMLNSRYQVVYPFPTFQPAFQLKKDQVIFLNTSYSLVACSVSLCPAGEQGHSSQILFRKRATAPTLEHQTPPSPSSSSSSHGSPDSRLLTAKPSPAPLSPSQSHAAARAREFAADLFRRAQGGGRENEGGERRGNPEGSEVGEEAVVTEREGVSVERDREQREDTQTDQLTSAPQTSTSAGNQSLLRPLPEDSIQCSAMTSPASSSSSPPTPHSSQEAGCSEPGYVNYTRLQYRMPQPGAPEQDAGGYEDDKVQLPFTVTDLKGRNLQLVTGPHNGQVCPETNTVVINIGLLLLAFSNPEEEHCRPNTYHSSLQVSWDLNTGVCHTVGVGDLTEVKGQTSGSVWSSYRKSCVNTVMKWLVPESSSRYINRMTNEALHKGSSLQVLADSDRSTWIIL